MAVFDIGADGSVALCVGAVGSASAAGAAPADFGKAAANSSML